MKIWFLDKGSFYLDSYFFAAAALVLTFIIGYSVESIISGLTAIVAIAIGVFLWSTFEYSLHRWAFHTFLSKEHMIHHALPANYIGAPNWVSIGSFFLVYGLLALLFPLGVASALALGFVFGYAWYLWIHHQDHHRVIYPNKPFYEIRSHHIRHHNMPAGNFGITTRVWDRLLGTVL